MTEASYEHITDGKVHGTVKVRSDLLFDVDVYGYVLGVERIGDRVSFGDLREVIQMLTYGRGRNGGDDAES